MNQHLSKYENKINGLVEEKNQIKEKMEEIQTQGVRRGGRGGVGSSQEREKDKRKGKNKAGGPTKIVKKIDTCPSSKASIQSGTCSGGPKKVAASLESAAKSPSPPMMKIEESKEKVDQAKDVNPVTDPEQTKIQDSPEQLVEKKEIKTNFSDYRDFMKQNPINHNKEEAKPVEEEKHEHEHDHHHHEHAHEHDHGHVHEIEQELVVTKENLQEYFESEEGQELLNEMIRENNADFE